MKTVYKILLAAASVFFVSGLIRICGLSDYIYFNKSFLSAALFLLTVFLSGRTWKEISRDKRRGLTAFFLSWLLIFTEILGGSLRLLENQGGVVITAGSVLWMFVCAFFLSWLLEPAFFGLLNLCWRSEKTSGVRSGKELNRIFLLSWLVLFAGWIPCFLAFYPGLYCYDMIWQWSMFDSGMYSTHHPLIHTLFAGEIIELGKTLGGSYQAGLALHSLVQMGILTGCMAFALRWLAKCRAPRVLWLGTGSFYLFFPFFPVSSISTTKDIIFGGLMLAVFVCLCDMVMEKRIYRGWKLGAFLFAAVLMGLFRNNAVYGLAFLAVCLFAAAGIGRLRKPSGHENGNDQYAAGFSRDGRRTARRPMTFTAQMAILLSVVILGIQGGFWGLEKGLHAQKGSVAEMLSMPVQQLARTYVYHQDDISMEDKTLLFSYLPEENLNGYKYYVSDPVKAGLNQEYLEENTVDFVKLWAGLGLQYPKEYLLAPLYNMMGLWYLGGDSSCYVEYEMSEPFDEEHAVETRSILPGLREVYCWFTDENLQENLPGLSIFFYTSFYVWAVLTAAFFALARRKYLYQIPVLFLGGYILTLVLGPCVTVRYLLGVIMAVPVLWICVTREEA